MLPDFPSEGEEDLAEELNYPCALGCDEHQSEEYPLSLGLDLDDPTELIQ